MFVEINVNPDGKRVGDCVIRAVSAALGLSWEEAFDGIAEMARIMHDMPSADHVWGQYLRKMGFRRYVVPCRDEPCTVREFCENHPEGVYVLALFQHVICVSDGNWLDTWDSGNEIPLYYYVRKGVD